MAANAARMAVMGSALLLGQLSCGQEPPPGVRIDGSSTVAPISMGAAELFAKQDPRVRVTVGISGTGGGFKKFLDSHPTLRTDINDSSRFIDPIEIERAGQFGVEFIELQIAMDGVALAVNPRNTFCAHLTLEELKRIWRPGSAINNWRDIRPGFPDLSLKLYGPGTDSGTFDYFTEVVVGKAKASRSDYTASENDNVLVQGISGDAGGLGYFGFAYYESNQDLLKLLAVDSGNGHPVAPSLRTIRDGAYAPLSRPLLLYVNRESTHRPEVMDFLRFYLTHARSIVEHPRVNYVAFSDDFYREMLQRLEQGVTGTMQSQYKRHVAAE